MDKNKSIGIYSHTINELEEIKLDFEAEIKSKESKRGGLTNKSMKLRRYLTTINRTISIIKKIEDITINNPDDISEVNKNA